MTDGFLYFYDGWLSVSPTTISVAKVLSKHFDNVNIYAQKTQFKPYKFKEKNIKVFYIFNSLYFKKEDKPKNFAKSVKKLIEKKNLLNKDDFFLCIDETSLEPVGDISEKYNNNLMYLSLELPNKNEYSEKQCEVFKKMKFVLVQDENRLKSLYKSYKTDLQNSSAKIFYLPNDSLPCNEPKPNLVNLIEQFKNIPENTAKCASIGMISSQVYSNEIAKVFNNIDNAILIYHDRLKIKKYHPYIKELIKTNSKNLYLSKQVYDFDDLIYVYSPIDIGIACYRATNNDFSLIGKASGKLNAYLKYKKPVIANRLDGLSNIIEKYDCGAVINNIENQEEWQNAINKIMSNYKYYSDNAYKCYLEEFDFTNNIKPFEEELTKTLKK